MGYPDTYKIKKGFQTYKQIGNSVVVPVVTEIAEKCGFSDVYHFSKIFKKLIGVPPTKYN